MSGSTAGESALPREPISRITQPLEEFMHVESSSGIVLLLATVTALVLANSPAADGFLAFWKTPVGFEFGAFQMRHSLQHWINDGLMAIFFFVIGLEVKREIVHGDLGNLRGAALPIAAAIGGMLVPAAIYLTLQRGEPGESGWGIPMATDIAFVVGCLALLGSRVPHGLRVLLLSVAIVDDIGAILVIAIGYTDAIGWSALAAGIAGIGAIALLSRLGVRGFGLYVLLGFGVWLAFHESGVHATIAGVILGLMTSARAYLSDTSLAQALERVTQGMHGSWDSGDHGPDAVRRAQWATRETVSPLAYLETTLHPWVGFAIMPLFALANAGVPFDLADVTDPVAGAVELGLVVGKPVGVVGFAFIAVRLGLARLPQGVGWGLLVGGGLLTGIGFTMALFIAGLALGGDLLDTAKVGILVASAAAAIMGMAVLMVLLPKRPDDER
ncbi:MAG: Na+/H+ antiporter NhaA [Deltaproteobacteria bacterium]|nr:MAG: Na+/H+ antiporter NhaA [Deltaproteobacteria bacterium]